MTKPMSALVVDPTEWPDPANPPEKIEVDFVDLNVFFDIEDGETVVLLVQDPKNKNRFFSILARIEFDGSGSWPDGEQMMRAWAIVQNA